MSQRLPILGAALAFALATISGCVDRRFVIESDPPGAIVYLNDKWVGPTPVDQSFTYYGKYRFVFARDGYEILTTDEKICTPWWSYFPLEFVVESLYPGVIRDHRTIHKQLEPRQETTAQDILGRAEQLRAQGGAGGAPYCPPGTTVAPGLPNPAPQLPPPGIPTTPVPTVTPVPVPQ
jgi:PEGA domain